MRWMGVVVCWTEQYWCWRQHHRKQQTGHAEQKTNSSSQPTFSWGLVRVCDYYVLVARRVPAGALRGHFGEDEIDKLGTLFISETLWTWERTVTVFRPNSTGGCLGSHSLYHGKMTPRWKPVEPLCFQTEKKKAQYKIKYFFLRKKNCYSTTMSHFPNKQ